MLAKYPNGTLIMGAIVSLSPDSDWVVDNREDAWNPLGVSGVVTHLYHDARLVTVFWSERINNTYRMDDYDLIAEDEEGFLQT